jgi:predicted Zn-dependent protease
MKKLIPQFLVALTLFFALWYGLSMLPWVKWFKAEDFATKRKKELSEIFLKLHRLEKKEIHDAKAIAIITGVRDRLCFANNIDTTDIHLHIFNDLEVNAFAIPGGHIVINSALIAYCDNPDMLTGVIAHEIGHIENGHLSKRFAKEIGLSVVMMFGGEHLGVFKELIRTMSSSKFDRGQESEADASAVRYMQKANVNPKPLGKFFSKMAASHGDLPEVFEWAGTHPDAKERAAKISVVKSAANYTPATDSSSWQYLTNLVN